MGRNNKSSVKLKINEKKNESFGNNFCEYSIFSY